MEPTSDGRLLALTIPGFLCWSFLCAGLAVWAVTGGRPRPLLLATSLAVLAWMGVKYVPIGAVVGVAWAWRFGRDRRALVIAALP